MNFKQKYINLKYNQFDCDEKEIIHIYYGGSFSPPTIAHQKICTDIILFLMKYLHETEIKIIILHIVPTSDMYYKPSVKPECIDFNKRVEMLEIIAQNINKEIKSERYIFNCKIDIIENIISHEIKSDGSGENGYVETYKYMEEFIKRNNYIPNNIYLLFGLDNAISLVSSIKKNTDYYDRWSGSIHMISNFKFLIYPRHGININYNELSKLFISNIESFKCNRHNQIDINLIDGNNNLEDIEDKLEEFTKYPIQFMKNRFIEIDNSLNNNTDIISIAETSSSNIRKILYDYTKEGFTIKQSKIDEILSTIDPNIKKFILENKLYTNGEICEGKDKFEEIKINIPIDWKK
jgi:nicotinic acid mononucleotide adenylyltransferase